MATVTLVPGVARRASGVLVTLSLAFGLIAFAPAPAQAVDCNSAETMCGTVSSHYTVHDINNTGPDGSLRGCGIDGNNSVSWCGTVTYVPHMFFEGTPGQEWGYNTYGGGEPPSIRNGFGGNYTGWQAWLWDYHTYGDLSSPTGSRRYPATGAGWIDTMTFELIPVYGWVVDQACMDAATLPTEMQMCTTWGIVDYKTRWLTRTINWWPIWSSGPDQWTTRNCAAYVTNATLRGPELVGSYPSTRGNKITYPFPVQSAAGTWVEETLKHTWNVVPHPSDNYQSRGLSWDPTTRTMASPVYRDWLANPSKYPTDYSPSYWDAYGYSTSINYMLNCQKIDYAFSTSIANNADCKASWNTTNYGSYPATPNCSQINGNFFRQADGYQLRCIIVQRNWPQVNRFIRDCTPKPVQCTTAECSPSGYVYYCDTANGQNWDDTYNFRDCTRTPPPPSDPKCIWPSGNRNPIITGPDGALIKNGSQMVPNGKQWTITYPKPSLSAGPVYTNFWQQWVMVQGSQPFKDGSAIEANDQPVFGHSVKSASPSTGATSQISTLYNTIGISNWDLQTLYLRSFKGGLVNNGANYSIGSGVDGYDNPEVANPLSVKTGDIRPYGLYESYNFTYQTRSSTKVGGTFTYDTGSWCRTNAAYMYMAGGRAASNG